MATGKSSTVNTTARNKDDPSVLKTKINELERQVGEYKTKLDELRRAKATTVVKLEKEYVNTGLPGNNRPEKSKICDKCDELEKILDMERKSNAQLKQLIEQKDRPSSTSCDKCSDLKQLLELEKQNNQQLIEQQKIIERTLDQTHSDLIETKNLCEALRIENEDYQKAFNIMKKEHSEKMAELCTREEEAKKQVATWEQMYREWMATMERRVNNLQGTNDQLQKWLHDDNEISPNRRSDTGQ